MLKTNKSRQNSKNAPIRIAPRLRVVGGVVETAHLDAVAVEEPLQIRLLPGGEQNPMDLAVTMRTPGHDDELAAGFLFTENVIAHLNDVLAITQTENMENVVTVLLDPRVAVDRERLTRHVYTASSCGVCGKASIAAVRVDACPTPQKNGPYVQANIVYQLPDTLRAAQAVFEQTGGLHAAALFDRAGNLRRVREDVGRHNALDKIIGAALLAGEVPLRDSILLVSGRTSFELVQKAVVAGIPIIAAVGAPSSLAVELAEESDTTLIGFLRGDRCNIYSAAWRILTNS